MSKMISNSLLNDDDKRAAIVELIKNDLALDVSAMLTVIIDATIHTNVWMDIIQSGLSDADQAIMIENQRNRIRSGEGKISRQDLDQIAEKK